LNILFIKVERNRRMMRIFFFSNMCGSVPQARTVLSKRLKCKLMQISSQGRQGLHTRTQDRRNIFHSTPELFTHGNAGVLSKRRASPGLTFRFYFSTSGTLFILNELMYQKLLYNICSKLANGLLYSNGIDHLFDTKTHFMR
jgi:hypothetical protein